MQPSEETNQANVWGPPKENVEKLPPNKQLYKTIINQFKGDYDILLIRTPIDTMAIGVLAPIDRTWVV